MKNLLIIIILGLVLLSKAQGQLSRPPGNPPVQVIPEPEVMPVPVSFLLYEVFASYEGEEKPPAAKSLIIALRAPINSGSDRIRAEELRRFSMRFTKNVILLESRKTFERIASGQNQYTWVWAEAWASAPIENFPYDPLFCRGSANLAVFVFNQDSQKTEFLTGSGYFGSGRGLIDKIKKDFFQEGSREPFFFYSLRWTFRRLLEQSKIF